MSAADLLGGIVVAYIGGAFLAFFLAAADDSSPSETAFLTVCWPLALVIAVVRGGKEFLNR